MANLAFPVPRRRADRALVEANAAIMDGVPTGIMDGVPTGMDAFDSGSAEQVVVVEGMSLDLECVHIHILVSVSLSSSACGSSADCMETSLAPVSRYANKFALFIAIVFAGGRMCVPVKTTRRHNMTPTKPNSLLHDLLGALIIAALIVLTSFYC